MTVDDLFKYLWNCPSHAKVYVRVNNQAFALLGSDMSEDGNELLLDIEAQPRHETEGKK